MTVTIPVAIRTSRANTLVDLVDVGSTNANGQLWFKDASNNVLSKHDMANPAFAAAGSGAAVADTIQSANGLLSGAAVKFTIVDRDEGEVFSGTVTAVGGGGDLESDTSSTQITAGQNVDVSSLTYVEGG
jgi:hypothetical protein